MRSGCWRRMGFTIGILQRIFQRAAPRSSLAGLFVACGLIAACGEEVVQYDALHLVIGSEVPEGGPITRIDFSIIGLDAAGAAVYRLPEKEGDAAYQVALPAAVDLVNKPFRLRIFPGSAPIARLQLRVRGLSDSLKPLTAFGGVIDNPAGAREVSITLRRPVADCDADGDGVGDCAKTGCCAPAAAKDCDDKNATASPFEFEDPCLECENGVDENCNGSDLACVDADDDGVADCQELKCNQAHRADKDVHPGAPELCDGKDNDCDGDTDEGLTYVGIDGKPGSLTTGAACGAGACAGGKVVCDADGKGLVCDSANKKAAVEDCKNQLDDDCNGKLNDGCDLLDIDGDGAENEVENKACKHPYAKFHSEIHPGAKGEACCLPYTKKILAVDPNWQATDPVPAKAVATDAELAVCDVDCDGVIKACAPKDADGDGVPAPLDCDDVDPTTYPNAPEKCGDGKVQSCLGADPACDAATDKDGDGWPGAIDCDDGNKAVFPGAAEVCNSADDDCDGVIDDGNPEAKDAACGNKNGECGKKPGISVCKHWPAGQSPGTPLDCLQKPYDAASGTCVGCEGDGRPTDDVCDYLDNDCDALSDEDYTYAEQGSGAKLVIGATCNGIGSCGTGKVECRLQKDKAVCSTDVEGSKAESKPEICDANDNDCNGVTDENLTSIADSSCHKAGACAGTAVAQILTVCVVGKWVCDYTKVPSIEYDITQPCTAGDAYCHCPGLGDGGKKCFAMVESSCEGKDNDCDGKTDDDFQFNDLGQVRLAGQGCGTGACASGLTVCKADATNLTCSTLPKISKEVCDAVDNDCNGKTDEGMTVTDSNCKLVGQCTTQNVKASCPAGKWVCDYVGVPSYQDAKEVDCDGKDNDCDSKTDEDFVFLDLGKPRSIGEVCGAGVCANGNVVCSADKKAMTCSTLVKSASDICDGADNDCDGKTDEDFAWQTLAIGIACDGVGACGTGVVECTPGKTDAATCDTNPDGSKKQNTLEGCNDIDDNCDGTTDEGCDDDKDLFCDAALTTTGTPKSCPKGGGDCKDNDLAFNPGIAESCDGKDQNCNGTTDEVFSWDEVNNANSTTLKLGVGAPCGLGACAAGTVVCIDGNAAACSTIGKKAGEVCDDVDNDCDGLTDEGCNDDGDAYCDVAINTVGKPKVCPQGGGDCNDLSKTTFPGAPEVCNDVDDDCNNTLDDACDKDKDGWCDDAKVTVGKPKSCPQGGGDCNDNAALHASPGANIHPTRAEICNDVDDNCSGKTDEGCDDDNDGYCDKTITTIGTPLVCPKGGGDCNDGVNTVFPTAVEACNDVDEDCDSVVDQGCDDDNDGWCDNALVAVNKPKACPNGGGDCNDEKGAGKEIHPAAAEVCNSKDDDCNGKTDAADAINLAKTAPKCENQKGVCANLVKALALCEGGAWKSCSDSFYASSLDKFEASSEKSCDDLDNNCSGATDEGCDDDADGYCDAGMTTAAQAKPKACAQGGGDCNDLKDAANGFPPGKAIHPAQSETCLTEYDDDCNGTENEVNAKNCIDFYTDADGDGWGNPAKASLCLCKANSGLKLTATQVGDCNDNSNDVSTYQWAGPDGKSIVLGGTCGFGTCSGGKVQCSGTAASCSTSSKAVTEFCNGQDDDCDTKIDGADDSLDMSGQSCAPKGVCASGSPKKTCVSGTLVCDFKGTKDYEAGTEKSCDGLDNDCDSVTDESFEVGAFDCLDKGVCKSSGVVPICSTGKLTCDYSKISGYFATETQCDNKDNDCDGKTDEDPDLSGLTCKSSGICKDKTIAKLCVTGTPTCDYGQVTGYEATEVSCNNSDDDCDGSTDEELSDVLKSTCKLKGVCNGNNVEAKCQAGGWSCKYNSPDYKETEIEPTENLKDGKDNDCDGVTDEGA